MEFLLADRTFSSLQAAAMFLLGKWSGPLVRHVVCWTESNVRPFLDAPCYKVAANDTEDDIVHDAASLRTGIAEWTARYCCCCCSASLLLLPHGVWVGVYGVGYRE